MRLRGQRLAGRLALALAVSGISVTALVTSATVQAAFPGRNGVLSVSYVFDCVGQIATLEPDGRPLRMLTPRTCAPPAAVFPGTLGRASWSPDGRRLIFDYMTPPMPNTDPIRLAVMNADGSSRRDVPVAPTTVTPQQWFDPTFTADGRRFLYTRLAGPEHRTEIRSAQLNGSDDRRHGYGRLPRMSPDGRRIAYLSASAITVMNAHAGTPIGRLWRGSVRSIDWSPDGKWLVFTGSLRNVWSPADVYVVRANGTRLRRLTTTVKASETDAVWSPNGRRIAFVRETTRRVPIRGTKLQAIWTLRPDGTAERRIRSPWIRYPEDGKGQVRISWQPQPHR
jgi:Tol biopolymer transport system component